MFFCVSVFHSLCKCRWTSSKSKLRDMRKVSQVSESCFHQDPVMWPQNFIFFCFCGPHWLWYRHQCGLYDDVMTDGWETGLLYLKSVLYCRLDADLIHRALRCERVTVSQSRLHSERMMTVQLLFLWVHWCWSSVQTNHLWDETAELHHGADKSAAAVW